MQRCEECGVEGWSDNPVLLTINGFLCAVCENINNQGEVYEFSWDREARLKQLDSEEW